MSNFELGVEIETETATVQVNPGPGAPLPPGRHRFQLVVEDESGNLSQPSFVDVVVRDTAAPTAVVTLVGAVDPTFNQPFELDGSLSSDAGGGTVAKYRWTLVENPLPPPAPPSDKPVPPVDDPAPPGPPVVDA